ncbi:MAG: hypothetical protein IJZ06_08455 [Bacteroidales bacterium]|nr:hypothetical protein [Bacteroidales bacterium]
MNQLDVDMLMENTRKLYDTLCSVKCNMDVNSIPMEIVEETSEILEPENLRTSETENLKISGTENLEEASEILEPENLRTSETENLKISETENLEEASEILEPENLRTSETENLKISETENIEETSEEELSNSATQQLSNSEEELSNSATQQLSNSEEELSNSATQQLSNSEEELSNLASQHLSNSEEKEDSGIRAYRKEHQTLGDMLELLEDNSLAARLQKKPVTDLMTAIGINDKFLLLNELFAGSMEKYNRSIRALNNFPTLLGAKTYMSELQIEFQWDVNSEAYRKLNDLVERRFTPIHNS